VNFIPVDWKTQKKMFIPLCHKSVICVSLLSWCVAIDGSCVLDQMVAASVLHEKKKNEWE
jgi:hypothetical protein